MTTTIPELAATIRAAYYAPDDPDTAEMLAHYNEFFPTLADCLGDDIRDMIHNGNTAELIGNDSLDDAALLAIDDFILDNIDALADAITALILA